MENKLTAVEWLIKQVKLGDKSFDEFFRGEIQQAKQMERSQIEKSFCDGFDDGYLLANGEDTKFDDCYLYYYETYGN